VIRERASATTFIRPERRSNVKVEATSAESRGFFAAAKRFVGVGLSRIDGSAHCHHGSEEFRDENRKAGSMPHAGSIPCGHWLELRLNEVWPEDS
jgi:hypothetical protein